MNQLAALLGSVCFFAAVSTAQAQSYKPTTPATGTWCNGKGTFVIQNGSFKYYRRGVLEYQASYRIAGNKIIKSGNHYRFFKNARGTKFYQRVGFDEMIRVRRRCRNPIRR